MTERITLEQIFGEFDSQYMLRQGQPCKPDKRLWDLIKDDVLKTLGSSTGFIYVGDKLITDFMFVEEVEGIQTIIAPIGASKEALEAIQKPENITITTQMEMPNEVIRMAQSQLQEYNNLWIGFDLDDTVFPKPNLAQENALDDLLSKLETDFGYDAKQIEFLKEGRIYFTDFQGSERKTVAMLTYLSQNGDPTKIDTEFIERLKKMDDEEMVNELAVKGVFYYSRKDGRIYSPELREKEADHTVEMIRDNRLFVYEPVFNMLMELQKTKDTNLSIVTNKPDIVMKRIYKEPFHIRYL